MFALLDGRWLENLSYETDSLSLSEYQRVMIL
jgi:hypothetical protein